MSADAVATQAPHVFIDGDKTYQVKMIGKDEKAAFEHFMYAVARETARDLKDLMTPAEWSDHLERLGQQKTDGDFQIVSARGAKFILTTRGIKWLVSTLFGLEEDAALDLMLRHKDEVSNLINTVLCESIPAIKTAIDQKRQADKVAAETAAEKMLRGSNDPNVQPPATPLASAPIAAVTLTP